MRVVSSAELFGLQQARSSLSVLLLGRRTGLGSLHVPVLYLSCQMSKRSHASSALSGSSLLLGSPVVLSEFTAGRHAGSGASSVLLVPVLLARVATERV